MLLLKNARIYDVNHENDDALYFILIEGQLIRRISREPIQTGDAETVDVNGRYVMPGMIDCHIHAISSVAGLAKNGQLPDTFAVLNSVPILKGMLMRGFTTARDAGGAPYALSQAIEQRLISGPRLFICGKALSQTGGHGDFRDRYDNREPEVCQCSQHIGAIGRIVDGVDAVRKAVREEMRSGAHQIKIMASGGVGSPTDPIGNLQFSVDEIRAIVEEAESHQTYVMAHAYTAKAIERIVRLGVRTIEHGNLIDDQAAAVMAEHGAYAVPTLVIYDAMSKVGRETGVPEPALVKNEVVRLQGLKALEILKRHGVKMGFGTDLLGEMHPYQSDELRIRAEVLGNAETLRQATVIGAEILNMEGKLGVVAEGAIADLLILKENPLENIGVLSGQGEGIIGIIKDGFWEKKEIV